MESLFSQIYTRRSRRRWSLFLDLTLTCFRCTFTRGGNTGFLAFYLGVKILDFLLPSVQTDLHRKFLFFFLFFRPCVCVFLTFFRSFVPLVLALTTTLFSAFFPSSFLSHPLFWVHSPLSSDNGGFFLRSSSVHLRKKMLQTSPLSVGGAGQTRNKQIN
jgi:hypothetical protein